MGKRQQGQAIVLAAVGMSALVAVVGLLLVGGLLYWERRQAQELADSAALAGAQAIQPGCTATGAAAVIDAADGILQSQLGGASRSSPSISGSCSTRYQGTNTYAGGSVSATINYPYNSRTSQVEILVDRTRQLELASVLGAGAATVRARAVAEFNGASLPGRYAMYAQNSILCSGNAPINANGSIYAGGLITVNGGCYIYAHDVPDPNNPGQFVDYGDVLVYASGQQWQQNTNAVCLPVTAANNAVCADGYEISQNTCGIAYVTEYLDASGQLGGGSGSPNPNPCANGASPSVPSLTFQNFLPPEPNKDPNAQKTLPGGSACQPNPPPASIYPKINVSGKVVGRGIFTFLPVQDAAGIWHFFPGCYGYLDISQLGSGARAALEPGFYYFNGAGYSTDFKGKSGGGLCLGGVTQLLAKDVTLEFVNNSSFSQTDCSQAPTSATNACPLNATNSPYSAGCGFGWQPCQFSPCPPNPGGDPFGSPTNTFTWFAAPCTSPPDSAGKDAVACINPSSWCPASDNACQGLLIWAPPNNYPTSQICGTFFLKGPGELSWLAGTIFWPGGPEVCGVTNATGCQYQANGTGTIAGELICQDIALQGGAQSSGAAITSYSSVKTKSPSEAALVE